MSREETPRIASKAQIEMQSFKEDAQKKPCRQAAQTLFHHCVEVGNEQAA